MTCRMTLESSHQLEDFFVVAMINCIIMAINSLKIHFEGYIYKKV